MIGSSESIDAVTCLHLGMLIIFICLSNLDLKKGISDNRKDTESLIARLVEEKLQTWVAKQRMEWSQHFLAQHHERRGASCQTMSLSVMSKPDPHS
ncbi:hypothetical protein OIU78_013931 [Salix suchowensis]|nr:hypothetical protein OIU78_013931 [Salix suchowensis]